MQKIVIDTNVLVSALLSKGYSSQIIYELVLSKKVTLCLSPSIFEEYVNVLFRNKFSKHISFTANAEVVLSKLEELAVIYEPVVKINALKDKDDNKFLELAVTADASFLITGNKNDFSITQYYSVKIISPKDYWEKFSSDSNPFTAYEPLPKYKKRKKKK